MRQRSCSQALPWLPDDRDFGERHKLLQVSYDGNQTFTIVLSAVLRNSTGYTVCLIFRQRRLTKGTNGSWSKPSEFFLRVIPTVVDMAGSRESRLLLQRVRSS